MYIHNDLCPMCDDALNRADERIATLEAELAASRADAKLAWAEASMGPTEAAITHELAQSQAHANALRGVLEKHARLCAERGVEQPAYMQAALAQTPAASLAAHDAEVLEPYKAALAAVEAALASERAHAASAWLALEETRCTCEAVLLGGMPSRLQCVRCRTLEAHAARRAAEVANDPR